MGLIFLKLQCDYLNWLLVKDYPITFFENKRFSSFFFLLQTDQKNSGSTMKTF